MSFLDVEKSRGQILASSGPMGARKSGVLVDVLKALQFNRSIHAIAYSHLINIRDGPFIVARDGDDERKYPAVRLATSREMYEDLRKRELESHFRYDVVAVDEANAYDDDQVPLVLFDIADGGRVVLVAGLDQTYRRDSFGQMGRILRQADQINLKTAYCQMIKGDGHQCGKEAKLSARVRRVTNENGIQPISYFTFKGTKSESQYGFDFFFSPTKLSRDDPSNDVDYFAACEGCHQVHFAQETLTVQDHIFRNPGIRVEELRKEYDGMPHLEEIITFLIDPTEFRTRILPGGEIISRN